MNNRRRRYFAKPAFWAGFCLLMALPLIASAAQVTLQWEPTGDALDGFRVYQRLSDQVYDYNNPVWTGNVTTCTIANLSENTTYYFVVRAYLGSEESGDSNELEYTTTVTILDPDMDSDGDGVGDDLDRFPEDPSEWMDTDGDGIGNNADVDDDGDGLPDTWELLYGLNPLVDDADMDLDHDGITNWQEFSDGSDPSQAPGNAAPQSPMLIGPADGAQGVEMTPLLMVDRFVDEDEDTHTWTTYQISTTEDFSALVYERTTALQLVEIQISELILDPETTYFWRARFLDSRNAASGWSEVSSFTTETCEAAGDSDCDGILDDQETESAVDLDADGTDDLRQTGLKVVGTLDDFNPNVAVKQLRSNVYLAGIRALDSEMLLLEDNRPDRVTGLISFKLYLLDDATMATVVVYLTEPAPADAAWYKYDMDQGWQIYPYARISEDRMSVMITLEDGGEGDEDGVQNGIIIDPSGLGYRASEASDTAVLESQDAAGGGGGCFIGAVSPGATASHVGQGNMGWILVLLTAALAVAAGRRACKRVSTDR